MKVQVLWFPPGTTTPCVWNRLNLSIVWHIILKMWHEPSFIYVLPWFLLAQASLWTAKVIGNKWDGPVGLQAHLLYLLCPDLITRSLLRTALHHTSVSRVSPSSLPRQRPPFPSPPFTSQPPSSVLFQQLPHNILTTPVSPHLRTPRGQLPHFLQPLNPPNRRSVLEKQTEWQIR